MDQLKLTLAKKRTSSIKSARRFSSSVYHALNANEKETRLLLVDTTKKDPGGRLICNLCHVSLSRPCRLPKYEAISWCWGDSEAKADILLDGKVYAIPTNAVKALNQLCFVNKHERVWIDCVCINQTDVKEQGHQVSKMQDIYSNAERVLVWLGDDDGLTQVALEAMQLIHRQCTDSILHSLRSSKSWERFTAAEQRRMLHRWFDDRVVDTRNAAFTLPDCQWHAVEVFYASPWFTRLWVVQEVILAKDIICYRGGHTRSWDFVGVVARWMIDCNYLTTHAHAGTPKGINNASEIWSNRYEYRSADLMKLLLMSISLETSDPKDKIFGIYGLLQQLHAPTGTLQLLEPDYTSSVEEIYTRATLACLAQQPSLRSTVLPLEIAHSLVPMIEEDRSLDKTPSWVPRYDWKFDPKRRTSMLNPRASKNLNVKMLSHPTDPSVIRVKGLHLGTVVGTSEIIGFDARCDLKEVSMLVVRLKELAMKMGVEERDFALTLTSGTSQTLSNPHANPHFMEQYRKFEHECHHECGAEFTDDSFSFCLSIWFASRERRLFQTSTNIGMGPSDMLPHDMIVILLGGNVPFVLRPSADEASYRIVGTAYVCNAMAGEFI